ncbi:MAG: hypothetical protein V6Z86_05505 [Hyphomicrobiales bacterium]
MAEELNLVEDPKLHSSLLRTHAEVLKVRGNYHDPEAYIAVVRMVGAADEIDRLTAENAAQALKLATLEGWAREMVRKHAYQERLCIESGEHISADIHVAQYNAFSAVVAKIRSLSPKEQTDGSSRQE